jgi:hypothetical protein
LLEVSYQLGEDAGVGKRRSWKLLFSSRGSVDEPTV